MISVCRISFVDFDVHYKRNEHSSYAVARSAPFSCDFSI